MYDDLIKRARKKLNLPSNKSLLLKKQDMIEYIQIIHQQNMAMKFYSNLKTQQKRKLSIVKNHNQSILQNIKLNNSYQQQQQPQSPYKKLSHNFTTNNNNQVNRTQEMKQISQILSDNDNINKVDGNINADSRSTFNLGINNNNNDSVHIQLQTSNNAEHQKQKKQLQEIQYSLLAYQQAIINAKKKNQALKNKFQVYLNYIRSCQDQIQGNNSKSKDNMADDNFQDDMNIAQEKEKQSEYLAQTQMKKSPSKKGQNAMVQLIHGLRQLTEQQRQYMSSSMGFNRQSQKLGLRFSKGGQHIQQPQGVSTSPSPLSGIFAFLGKNNKNSNNIEQESVDISQPYIQQSSGMTQSITKIKANMKGNNKNKESKSKSKKKQVKKMNMKDQQSSQSSSSSLSQSEQISPISRLNKNNIASGNFNNRINLLKNQGYPKSRQILPSKIQQEDSQIFGNSSESLTRSQNSPKRGKVDLMKVLAGLKPK